MKLNLHPKEFLALYNLLEEHRHAEFDDNSLREVYNRMRSYIVMALSIRDEDSTQSSIDAWFKVQQKKIAELKEKNDALKISTKEGHFLSEVPRDAGQDSNEKVKKSFRPRSKK